MNNLEILGARRVTRSKFHNDNPKILSTTVQNVVARTVWYQEFVHPWFRSVISDLMQIRCFRDAKCGPTYISAELFRTIYVHPSH
jgi:hypothetical protein